MTKQTVIFKLASKKYHLALVDDPVSYIRDIKANRGFFTQKRNRGRVEIVFIVDGDYYSCIHRCGARQFMNLISSYSPFNHLLSDVCLDLMI